MKSKQSSFGAKPAKLYAKPMYLSFKEFVDKYGSKNEATSNKKIKEILKLMNKQSSFGTAELPSSITKYRRRFECGIYMRDNKFTTTSGIVNLHQTKGTHWVMFSNQIISIHMAVHLQLIYSITLIRKAPSVNVSIQKIKFRKMIVIVYLFYILHKL